LDTVVNGPMWFMLYYIKSTCDAMMCFLQSLHLNSGVGGASGASVGGVGGGGIAQSNGVLRLLEKRFLEINASE
jgi:hypothetical protein